MNIGWINKETKNSERSLKKINKDMKNKNEQSRTNGGYRTEQRTDGDGRRKFKG